MKHAGRCIWYGEATVNEVPAWARAGRKYSRNRPFSVNETDDRREACAERIDAGAEGTGAGNGSFCREGLQEPAARGRWPTIAAAATPRNALMELALGSR